MFHLNLDFAGTLRKYKCTQNRKLNEVKCSYFIDPHQRNEDWFYARTVKSAFKTNIRFSLSLCEEGESPRTPNFSDNILYEIQNEITKNQSLQWEKKVLLRPVIVNHFEIQPVWKKIWSWTFIASEQNHLGGWVSACYTFFFWSFNHRCNYQDLPVENKSNVTKSHDIIIPFQIPCYWYLESGFISFWITHQGTFPWHFLFYFIQNYLSS